MGRQNSRRSALFRVNLSYTFVFPHAARPLLPPIKRQQSPCYGHTHLNCSLSKLFVMSTEASSSEYSLRANTILAWAEDLKALAALKDDFERIHTELEHTRSENITLKTALQTSQSRSERLEEQIRVSEAVCADAQVHQTRATILERQLTMHRETINEQNLEIRRLHDVQGNSVERQAYVQLLESYNALREELNRANSELTRTHEAAALRRRSEAELKVLRTNAQYAVVRRSSDPPRIANLGQSAEVRLPTAADPKPPREPESTDISQSGNRWPNPDDLDAASASTCRLPTPITTAPEITSGHFKKEEKMEEDEFSILEPPSTYLTPLPESRRKQLSQFHDFIFDNDEPAPIFSRPFLSNVLGGSGQPLIVSIALQKPLAKACNIKKFLCPNLSKNPWCPQSPGTHGYMFVGLGGESETFREPEQLNLFFSTPPTQGNSRNLEVRYLGLYEAFRVSELTTGEWRTLAPVVRDNYAEIVVSRGKNKGRQSDGTTQQKHKICSEYDRGALSVPCVRLVCVGFDEALYEGLLAASNWRKRDRDASESDSPDPKRRRRETM
ncbi:hypothetical protein C8R46DRAFT_220548 [Mycena filopes]|nr:hypothetical protein C8R46DRAFT_220548 [Mycena filopes]